MSFLRNLLVAPVACSLALSLMGCSSSPQDCSSCLTPVTVGATGASIEGKAPSTNDAGNLEIPLGKVLVVDVTRESLATLPSLTISLVDPQVPDAITLHGRLDGVELSAAQLAGKADWRGTSTPPKTLEVSFTTTSPKVGDALVDIVFGDVATCVNHRYDPGCHNDP